MNATEQRLAGVLAEVSVMLACRHIAMLNGVHMQCGALRRECEMAFNEVAGHHLGLTRKAITLQVQTGAVDKSMVRRVIKRIEESGGVVR